MQPLVRFIKHVILAVLVIIGSTCMIEVGLRAQRLHRQLSGQTGDHVGAIAAPCPIAFQHLPFSEKIAHWSPDAGTTIEVTTNSLGMRGPEVTIPKPPGLYRIVCLGDEATLAQDIPEAETFSSVLPAIFSEQGTSIEVINAGQPGHCPLLSLAWARARLIGLQPDLVILCCDVSDVEDDRRYRPLAKFGDDGSVLAVKHPAIGSGRGDVLSAVEREFMLVQFASEQFGQQLSTDSLLEPDAHLADTHEDSVAGHPTVLIEQAWEPLAGMQSLCQQISAELVVAVIPSTKTVRATASPGTNDVLRLLAERASREQIPLLDASSEFAQYEDQAQLFLTSSGALSSKGHRLFAQILGQALLERQSTDSTPVAIPTAAEVIHDDPLTTPLPTLGRRPRHSSSSTDWAD